MNHLLLILCLLCAMTAKAQPPVNCTSPSFYFEDVNGNAISSMDSLGSWTSVGYTMPIECENSQVIIDSTELSFAGFIGYRKSIGPGLSEKAIRFCKKPISIKRQGSIFIWYSIIGVGSRMTSMRITP